MKSRHGFTLFEMLVVISILALLIFLTVPDLSAVYQQRQLQNSAVLLHNDLRWAQARAGSQQENIQVKFQRQSYQIINLDDGQAVIRTVILPKQIAIKQGSSVFFAGAYQPGGNGHIVIGNERRNYYVYYYRTGRIRLSQEANS